MPQNLTVDRWPATEDRPEEPGREWLKDAIDVAVIAAVVVLVVLVAVL